MSENRKPYFVEVEIKVRVPVVADSRAEAEALGREYVSEEIEAGYGIEECIEDACATEATEKTPNIGALPWGVPDDDPRRNWTMKQWLDAESVDSEA